MVLTFALAALPCAAQPALAESWIPVRGDARQLAIATDGAVFVLDRSGRPWRRRPGPASIWAPLPGVFVRIDAGPPGTLWALDAEGRVFRYTGSSWIEAPAVADDIGVGTEGSVYVLERGGTVARYDSAHGVFVRLEEMPPAARAIDVDDAGLPWVVLATGALMRYDGAAWRAVAAPATVEDLAIAADGTVLMLTRDRRLYRMDPPYREWTVVTTPAPVHAMGANSRGRPWLVMASGEILALDIDFAPAGAPARAAAVFTRQLPWTRVRGTGSEIAIGPGGEAYSLGLDGQVWQWKGRDAWSLLPGRLERIAVAPNGLPWGVDEDGRILRYRGSSWVEVPGRARAIAIGASGAIWILLPDGVPAYWNDRTLSWEPLRGVTATRVAVDPDGRPWVLASDGSILRHDGTQWQALPRIEVQDIAVGPEGTVFAAGSDNRPYRFDPTQREWIALNGEASRIAVGPNGAPWAVTPRSEIYAASRFEEELQAKAAEMLAMPALPVPAVPLFGNPVKPTVRRAFFFQKVPGAARDIAIGNDGSVFAIGFDGNLVRWNNVRSLFLPFPGTARRIAVQRDGNPWVVTVSGEVFRYDGRNWQVVRNIRAVDIAIGGAAENRDEVIVADAEGALYRYDRAADRFERLFSAADGAAPSGLQVAVDGRGRPWTITSTNQVFRCDVDPCTFVSQGARDIAIGAEDSVFIVDMDRHLRRFDRKTERFERLEPTEFPIEAVAVGPGGVPWIVKTNAEIFSAGFFQRDESRDLDIAQTTVLAATSTAPTPVFTFSLTMRFDTVATPAPVFNIAISSRGLVIAIEPGGRVFVFDQKRNTFVENTALRPAVPFFRLAIEADGTLWGVDFLNRLLRREGARYVGFPGLTSNTAFPSAIGIGVGGEGSVLATSPDNTLFRFNPKARRFERTEFQYSGFDNQLSVDQKGRPWIIDAFNDIYEFTGTGFEKRPGKGQDVWAGANGSVFLCDDANRLKRWSPTLKNWEIVLNVQCSNVAVNIDGRPWIVTPAGQVLRAR